MIIQTIIGTVQSGGGGLDTSYPVPGSGDYQTANTALSGITYANLGTPYAPTGDVASVLNSGLGLYRSKYNGNFCSLALDTVSSYNLTFFNELTPMASLGDIYVSWGAQTDGPLPGQSLFSIQWKGYLQVPSTQNYNLYVTSDDTCAVWIGSSAVTGFNAGNCIVSSSNKGLPGQAASSRAANSMTLNSSKWYPIRIWFSEFTGGCKFQLFMQGADGTKLRGTDLSWAYNDSTGGFNP